MKTQVTSAALRLLAAFFARSSGQNVYEYLLVIGAVAVVFAAGLMGLAALIPQVVGYACPAIDTFSPTPVSIGSCLH